MAVKKTYRRPRHRAIAQVLSQLNSEFMFEHGIGFGGGSRIAMEIDEYRESADIDLFCPSTAAYRAVRETVHGNGLGDLARNTLAHVREVRIDRYGVRTAVRSGDVLIKLEVLAFDDWNMGLIASEDFDVPIIDRCACFSTKITAANDRGMTAPFKDVFDLLAMRLRWGDEPDAAIEEAARHYGTQTLSRMQKAVDYVLALPRQKSAEAGEALGIEPPWMAALLRERPGARPMAPGPRR